MDSNKLLEVLRKSNNVKIYSIFDDEFKSYGRVLTDYNFDDLCKYMEDNTSIPNDGNVYVASNEDMEKYDVVKEVKSILYGGMDIQVGYCNGKNSTYNGFEYHKGSEVNVAVSDFMLALGHSYDIKDNTYDVSNVKVFFVPKGSAIEMYQTTLHLSPLRVFEEGFKGIVILPKGTNTPLNEEEIKDRDDKRKAGDKESVLLLQRNKWVIAHPDREPLIKQGAFPGVIGENIELFYL